MIFDDVQDSDTIGRDFSRLSDTSVFIVDDSEFAQKILVELCEELGFEVKGTALDGLEAIEKLQDVEVGVVLMDIIMPNMHGIEAYRLLKNDHPDLPILFVSCLAKDHILESSFDNEIPRKLFIAKPLTLESLSEGIEFASQKDSHFLNPPKAISLGAVEEASKEDTKENVFRAINSEQTISTKPKSIPADTSTFKGERVDDEQEKWSDEDSGNLAKTN